MTTKTDDIKLLACPFCGGQNLDIEMDDPPYVMCHDCGAYGPDTLKPDARPSDVAEVWNRRAAVEADRREYLDTLKLARAIVSGHRRDNPPEDSVEADRQSNDTMLAHEWIRPALNLPDDAPYRFDYYAQKIGELMADRQDHIADARKMVPSDIDEIMIRVQEYASAWALVGTTFDDGTLMGQAEQSKTRIREALVEFGSSQPAISDMQLQCILQVYDDALDKAREGREFDNPGRPGSLEARAWDAGTRRGKELGPITQPAASEEPNAEARRALEIASNLRKDFDGSDINYDTILDAAKMLEQFAAIWSAASMLDAPVAQEPVAHLACDPETGEPVWGEDCVCKDNVYSPEDTGTIGRPVVFAPVAVQPVVTDEMVTRFLGWHLPQDFAPDAGISFNPSPDPHSWPVGTNLLTDPQARAMLEYVLQGAPAAQALPCNHVLEARPIDGSTSANVSCEPVCRKCGYRPAAHAAKGATL